MRGTTYFCKQRIAHETKKDVKEAAKDTKDGAKKVVDDVKH